jgi:hypothetical protein
MSVRIKPRCNGPVHLPVIRIGCNRRCVGTTTSINEATIWRVESSEGARIPLMPREVIFHWLETMIVRCIDSLFQTDVLVEGGEYEVRTERDDCYILSGFDKGFSKTRFEIVSHPSNARDRGN